jgi:hypothetical protein
LIFITRLIKKIKTSGQQAQIYWLFTGQNIPLSYSNYTTGSSMALDSPGFGCANARNERLYHHSPIVWRLAQKSLQDPFDSFETSSCVQDSSTGTLRLNSGQLDVINWCGADLGLPSFSTSAPSSLTELINYIAPASCYSPAEMSIVQNLQNLSASCFKGQSPSSQLIGEGSRFTNTHHFLTTSVNCGQAPKRNIFNKLLTQVSTAKMNGQQIIQVLPNLQPSSLNVTPAGGGNLTLSGTYGGGLPFSITGCIYWKDHPLKNLMMQSYIFKNSGYSQDGQAPSYEYPITARSVIPVPANVTIPGGSLATLGANITYSVSDPNTCGGGASANAIIKTYVVPADNITGTFPASPDYAMLVTEILFYGYFRTTSFITQIGTFVQELCDPEVECAMLDTAASITRLNYQAMTGTPYTGTLGNVPICSTSTAGAAGVCTNLPSTANLTTRPEFPLVLVEELDFLTCTFPSFNCSNYLG